MEDNPLNYSCCERTENSRLENYKMTLGVQETYRLLPRRRGRPLGNNAARERSRVKTLRSAFLDLQRSLPSVPPDTKLSKLDVLVLATTYIAHLMRTLRENGDESKALAPNGGMHPVKKWPMRARLYAGILSSTDPSGPQEATDESQEPEFAPMSSSCSWSPAIETYFR